MELDFKTLYHYAPCGYLYAKEDGTLIEVNNTFLALTGYAREEIIATKRFEDFLAIGGKIYYETHFVPLLQMQGEVSQINFDFIRKDGTRFPVLINALKQSANEKQPGHIQFIVLDITQRKQYEMELMTAKRESEELLTQLFEFRYFFDGNHDLCGIANTTGYFEKVNAIFNITLGYEGNELIENSFIDLIHPDDVAFTLEQYNQVKEGVTLVNFTNRFRKKDGSYIYLDWNVSPNIATGKLYCIARDTTDRRKIEEVLRRSLQETSDYKYALEESAIIALTDQKGIIKHVNDNFCTISKYSREELVGQDHRIINSGYHPEEFMRDVWVTIANGKIWKGEFRNKAKDGTFYWVDTTIVPFIDGMGKPYQYLAIRSDITPRKKAEEGLREVNKELEAFSYSVSHDLRAPLRAVIGFAQILEEDYGEMLNEDANQIIKDIKKGGTQMGQLIDDLLNFSRLGRKELVVHLVNLDDLVKDVCKDLQDAKHSHTIDFVIHELRETHCDSNLVRQIWINLIGNAVKYSNTKEKSIIEIGSKTTDGEVVYYVKDNGVGFDMRFSNKLFGVFQRLHSQEEFEGTGDGLAIVQRIVNRHGGRIWAESKLNEGATFYFTLKPLK